ncbi:TetR family transcriptional regulator [Streptomyces alkaliphilus]|uniref:TetR family transcriptional regulator n=1 Tax=Streptomyces alkaliphilus TaxID=1472722 RepID=A0A7W3Y1Z2_9ACTN|nr:TetR/AcrR family transcriptional regulator [Streptomyces alkaliphilus]MBB0245008.1 TetR family transcriptional regulator [Streptomyces alkaliphilus]
MSTPPAPADPAYRRLSADARREQLIRAAQGLFAHHAPEDVSPEDVARAAGVSRPLVYRYFPGGKQQLYEAVLLDAAEELEGCFTEPRHGPLPERLARALDRYLAFVEDHAEGFTALLRGGGVAETSRTGAIVDRVRRAAADQIMAHMAVERPGPLLLMAVRTWISAVEAASLTWLDEGRRPGRAELRDWLVDHCSAVLAATARHDPQTAAALAAVGSPGPEGARRGEA